MDAPNYYVVTRVRLREHKTQTAVKCASLCFPSHEDLDMPELWLCLSGHLKFY